MKFASVRISGRPTYGLVADGGFHGVPADWQEKHPTLQSAIAADALAGAAAAARSTPALPFADADVLPLIPNPPKIFCIGKNYAAHAAEGGTPPPALPMVFSRFDNTLVGHGHPMLRPKVSGDFDYEGELAVIIGKGGRHIAEADALSHIAGYACFNDGSIRDYQFKHGLIAGKNFFRTGGFGPVLTTADEVSDPSTLTLLTRVNGQEVQHGHTSDLIFSVPYLIAYLSAITELVPGDVIATGTPEGVGFARRPPLWLKAGDRVEIEIPGVGLLANPVADEA